MFILTLPIGPTEGSCKINGTPAEYILCADKIHWRKTGETEWQIRSILDTLIAGDLSTYVCDDGPDSDSSYEIISPAILEETRRASNANASSVVTTEERSPADIAADFAGTLLMHRHRGVINCDSYFVLFGNDGHDNDQRSRKEAADVWGKLRQYNPESGLSSNGQTWTVVLTDHTRTLFDEEELNQLVWDTWTEVCDELMAK